MKFKFAGHHKSTDLPLSISLEVTWADLVMGTDGASNLPKPSLLYVTPKCGPG